MPIITVKNLDKTFTFYKKPEGIKGSIKSLFYREKLKKNAVRNLSFSIEKGEFVGFLGPNGAGKTTTLKMLTGILYPTGGKVKVLGHEPKKREDIYKKKFAIVMGQKSQLWNVLPALETFRLLAKIYEIPEKIFKKRLDELVELMEIQDVLHVQVRKLSLGQRMKCELIASLLHDPKVLFLDEPTIGLDVVSQKKVREFLKYYNEKYKVTVLLTSHYMDDVQDLCKRLIIIDDGELGYDGPLDEIIQKYSTHKVVKVLFDQRVNKKDLKTLGEVMAYSPFETSLRIESGNSKKNISKLISKFPTVDINIHDVTLEEIVSDIFSKK